MFVRLTPTFVWSPRQSVSRLPGSVVVERSTALAVITCSVVSANTLPMDLAEREEGKERECSLATSKMIEVEVKGWEEQRGQCDGEESFPREEEFV